MELIYFIIDFAHTFHGIIVAIAAILGSVAYIIRTIREWEKLRKEKGVKMELKELKKGIKVLAVLSIVLLFLGTGILLVYATTDPLPFNVKLTNAAWKAFNKGDYKEAIKKAEQCIEEFEPSALKEQKELEKNNTPQPPKGKVSEDVKKVILNRGLLNDVATCWFIKGRSFEKLRKNQEAIQAYGNAAKYTYARTWDPEGKLFWSPAAAADDRKSYLEERRN